MNFNGRTMNVNGRTIRLSTRLLVTCALLLSATVIVVAGIAVLLTRGFMVDALDDRLSSTVESFRDKPAADVSTPAELSTRTRLWLKRNAFAEDQVVAVRTADGRVLSRAGTLGLEEIPDARSLLEATTARWSRIEAADGEPIRALSVPIFSRGEQIGTFVAVASESNINQTLSALLSGIAWAASVGLVVSALIGFAVIRRTLAPLERMAADIKSVQDAGDLSRRVSEVGPRDEVGRVAESFNKMLSRLQEVFASQRRFLSDASHELRTPVTIARGQLELIAFNRPSSDNERSVRVAREELDRMGSIVEELLLLARLDEGMPLACEPVEVELVLREALLRGMLVERRNATVEIDTGLFAMADEDRLLQVLTNLVTNAVQHTDGDAMIFLSSRADGQYIVINVADTGRGIPPADLPHVFKRFYRASKSKAESSTGSGLGLPIAASLTEAMGGNIHVVSGPEGTTFRVSLPRADVPATRPVHPEEAIH
jgi:two-component system OmpR family sensor kinase